MGNSIFNPEKEGQSQGRGQGQEAPNTKTVPNHTSSSSGANGVHIDPPISSAPIRTPELPPEMPEGMIGAMSPEDSFLGSPHNVNEDMVAGMEIDGDEGDRMEDDVHMTPPMKKQRTDDTYEISIATELTADTQKRKVCLEDFELLRVIGKGSFGKVMQVRQKATSKIYAMKVLRKECLIRRKQVEHTKTERRIVERVHHPFIVSLRYAFQTGDKLYLILDYLNGGELFYHLKRERRFSEERVRFYVAQITMAIEHLHKLDIVYRDLKPENILLDAEGHIAITDFGLAKEAVGNEGETHTFCGTAEYLAPEILRRTGHGKSVDWWSLGTLMYEMITGLPPFYSENLNIMYAKILKDELKFPPYLSAEAKGLLQGLLVRDVSERLGSGPTDAEEIKKHPFFASIDWEMMKKKEITPPFKPKVADELDHNNFDPEFTKQTPKDSPVDSMLTGDSAKDLFGGFSYVAPTPHFPPPGMK